MAINSDSTQSDTPTFTSIVTHSGMFHADDVFSAAVAKTLVPTAPILRTRDPELLRDNVNNPNVLVFDVGDHHDPELNNFDHHQRGFAQARSNGIPYASIGLVWSAYGALFCSSILLANGRDVDPELLPLIVELVDRRLIWALDAADCGELAQRATLKSDEAVEIPLMNLSATVAGFGPSRGSTPQAYDEAFLRAADFAVLLLEARVLASADYFEARAKVERVDTGDAVLVLEDYVPWHDHIKEHHRFVISPALDKSGWMVETVQDDYVSRLPFPESWGGLRAEALAKVSGVEDAIFCHRARFIAAAKSKEGALQLVARTLADVS